SPWCVSHLPSPLSSTLFPYTTLFRSPCLGGGCSGGAQGRDEFSRGKRRKPAQQLGGGVGEVDEWGRKHPHGHGRRGRGEQFVGVLGAYIGPTEVLPVEQRGDIRVSHLLLFGEHFPEHTGELVGHLPGVVETQLRFDVRGT